MKEMISKTWDFLDWGDKSRLVRVLLGLTIACFIIGFLGFVPSESMYPTLKERDVIVGSRVFNDYERGDIVRLERNGSKHIKRIAGVPGDRITVSGETVIVNGQGFGVEGLEEITLGPDEYYVTGDNIANSFDSRYYGPIKREQLVGEVKFILSPLPRMGTVD